MVLRSKTKEGIRSLYLPNQKQLPNNVLFAKNKIAKNKIKNYFHRTKVNSVFYLLYTVELLTSIRQ